MKHAFDTAVQRQCKYCHLPQDQCICAFAKKVEKPKILFVRVR